MSQDMVELDIEKLNAKIKTAKADYSRTHPGKKFDHEAITSLAKNAIGTSDKISDRTWRNAKTGKPVRRTKAKVVAAALDINIEDYILGSDAKTSTPIVIDIRDTLISGMVSSFCRISAGADDEDGMLEKFCSLIPPNLAGYKFSDIKKESELSRVTFQDIISLSSLIDAGDFTCISSAHWLMMEATAPNYIEGDHSKIGGELLWATQPDISIPDEEVDQIKKLQEWMRKTSKQSRSAETADLFIHNIKAHSKIKTILDKIYTDFGHVFMKATLTTEIFCFLTDALNDWLTNEQSKVADLDREELQRSLERYERKILVLTDSSVTDGIVKYSASGLS